MVYFLGKAPYKAEIRRPVKGALGIIVVIALVALSLFGWTVYEQINTANEKTKIGSMK